MPWFQLVAGGDPTDPNDYTLVTTPTCVGAAHICAIYTSADVNNKPIITTPLRNEMVTALNKKVSTASVLLRDTP